METRETLNYTFEDAKQACDVLIDRVHEATKAKKDIGLAVFVGNGYITEVAQHLVHTHNVASDSTAHYLIEKLGDLTSFNREQVIIIGALFWSTREQSLSSQANISPIFLQYCRTVFAYFNEEDLIFEAEVQLDTQALTEPNSEVMQGNGTLPSNNTQAHDDQATNNAFVNTDTIHHMLTGLYDVIHTRIQNTNLFLETSSHSRNEIYRLYSLYNNPFTLMRAATDGTFTNPLIAEIAGLVYDYKLLEINVDNPEKLKTYIQGTALQKFVTEKGQSTAMHIHDSLVLKKFGNNNTYLAQCIAQGSFYYAESALAAQVTIDYNLLLRHKDSPTVLAQLVQNDAFKTKSIRKEALDIIKKSRGYH